MMNEAVRALSATEIVAQSERHIDDFLDGGDDLEAEDIQSALAAGVDPKVIGASWAHAKTLRPNGLKPEASFILPSAQPKMRQQRSSRQPHSCGGGCREWLMLPPIQ